MCIMNVEEMVCNISIKTKVNTFILKNYETYILSYNLMDLFKQIDIIDNDQYVLPIPQRLGTALLYNSKKKVLIGFGSDIKSIKFDLNE